MIRSAINDHDLPPTPEIKVSRSTPPPPSLWHEIMGCLSSPLFLASSFGYASYSAVVAGLGFYGPLFIQHNRPCDPQWTFSQEDSDFYFGATVAGTGFIGTAVGGLWLDRKAKALPEEWRKNRFFNVVEPAWTILWQVTIGMAFASVSSACLRSVSLVSLRSFSALCVDRSY
jgi:hypothetical protein